MNSNLKVDIVFILLITSSIVDCLNENATHPENPVKALSRSKASVWVDTHRGSVFSTSTGSSHLERSNKTVNNEPVGKSSNMLLTLLLQPTGQMGVSPVQSPTEAQETHLKPILLLLQQQQDLSELLLEKEEKIEKMSVHLQQQLKQQQLLIVDLLEQIKLFLEVINSPGFTAKSSDMINSLELKHNNDMHHTSASSSANAIVAIPKKKAPENNIPGHHNISTFKYNKGRVPPILVTSQSETSYFIKNFNKTSSQNITQN